MQTPRDDLRALNDSDLTDLCVELGQPAYRARQISEWLWKHRVTDIAEMTSLPSRLRDTLAERFEIRAARAESLQKSSDGSIKIAYTLHDGEIVEGVFIPGSDGRRSTACISSQVGCSLRCAFCATARIPVRRNLDAGEIVDQVDDLNRRSLNELGRPLTNVVYMGMGEPLANYSEVVRSIRLLTSEIGFGMAARRITLSTAGLPEQMHALADQAIGINLALSLHAATDSVRRSLMSSARDWSLDQLADAVRYWHSKHGKPVTFEYLLLAGHNDSADEARALARFASRLPCKINLIEYNPVIGIPFSAAGHYVTDRFAGILARAGVTVTVRRSSGRDIDAACGQLAGRRSPSKNAVT